MHNPENNPLAGRHILFLGSSVTYGFASGGVSFADYIARRNGCTITKEAVSGTTLVDEDSSSYISRLKGMDRQQNADLFVCQLSTNDASKQKPLGQVSASRNKADFDTWTVAGAIEYIIAYVRETWCCPVLFYTNPRFESPAYAQMVALLHKAAEKWDIGLIDMWSDSAFGAISPRQREKHMADPIHPTASGYLEWWTPYMEHVLYQAVAGDDPRRADMLEETIARVRRMEACFDALYASVHAQQPSVDAVLLDRLTCYYEGGQWRQDFVLDEQGLLPPELKRGVLSEDAVYDLLADVRNIFG